MQRSLLWFIPPRVRPSTRAELRRAQVVVGGSLLTTILATLVGVVQAAWGIAPAAKAGFLAAAVSAALPLWIRATGRWKAAAIVLTASIWIPALAVSILTVGVLSATLYYLALAAAVAALTLGHRVALAIGAVNAIVAIAIYKAWLAGVHPMWVVDPDIARQSAIRGAFILNVGLAALVGAYELLRAATVRESEANERRFRALADQGPDLIAELDPAGRVASGNAGGMAFASAIAPGVRGGDLDGAVHASDRAAVLDAFRVLDNQPTASVGPMRWTHPSGRTVWVEASFTRYVAEGESRTLVVARDVSPRIALESQLRQSQKMQAVGQLASGLAHDFNNLLMVISGYSEIVGARVQGDRASVEATEEIRRATAQGAALTRRLLGLARPTKPVERVLDANAVVRDCTRLLRVLLGEGIALRVELARRPLPVRADAGDLEQVLVNLVANAKEALGMRGEVRLSTGENGTGVAITVHDNGPGIPPDIQERIFEPFFTTRSPGQGTGLGLFIVYSVVQRLGGEIRVESSPALGTTFTITLPLADGTMAGQVPPPVAAGGSERILVVEDRPELRSLVRHWLEASGYQVDVAADGVEALEMDVTRTDLVVSDVVMPRMGGPALVAALRQARHGLRAVFVSGGPTEGVDVDARDPVLPKPFDLEQLGRVIREVLDR